MTLFLEWTQSQKQNHFFKTSSAEGGFHLRKFRSNSSELESITYLRNFQMI